MPEHQTNKKKHKFCKKNLIWKCCISDQTLTIAFDPSHVNKSGKATAGLGYFWSGVAGKAKWGLEISGIAAIDIDNHTAFHLEAVQTPNDLNSQSLLDHYRAVLIARKETLLLRLQHPEVTKGRDFCFKHSP